MLQYQSRRHKCLMAESEQALCETAETKDNHEARIAKQLLDDAKFYGIWESTHAKLVLPVAEENRPAPQVIKLRGIDVRLVHRQALIDHIRANKIVGAERDGLFEAFYGPRATTNAMLIEHKQYMLAVSSWVSSQHLLDVMRDPISVRLTNLYKKTFDKYFELYCFVNGNQDSACRDAATIMMLDARRRARDLRSRINSEKPRRGISDVERQALLAKSGRIPVENYMIG